MVTTSPGLPPLSPPAPAVAVDYLRADLLAALPDDVKALVIGPCMDMVTEGAAKGERAYVLMRLRGMLRRLVRGLYEVEARRAANPQMIDVDTTRW